MSLVMLLISLFSLSSAHVFISPLSLIKYKNIIVKKDMSVTIVVKPGILNNSSVWALISITGVSDPHDDDWCGLYTLNDDETTINVTNRAPVKFQYCREYNNYLSSGICEFRFYLINMRHDYIVGFFRGGIDNPILVSTSNRVKNVNPNQPLQGHLSLTHDPDKIILQWVTKNTTDPQVQWGTQSGQYVNTKQANNSKYTVNDLCGSPATDYGWMDSGTIHTVTMDNLKPSTRYYYIFGSNSYGWSKEFSFISPPLTDPKSAVRIIAYGDLGHGERDGTIQIEKLEQASLNTTKHVTNEINKTDLVIHIGDLSYAVGFSAEWDEYYNEIEPVAANSPYMVCPGNHETDWPNTTSYFNSKDSGGECNIPYIYRNPMPREAPDSPWYGFDFGCIHFVVMSTENNFTVGSPQYYFLIRHLESVNRTKTPWLIFTGHRPMYVNSNDTKKPYGMQPIAQLLRDSLESILKKYKVDIAFWGHHHTYQRTCKMYQGQCTNDGIIHIIIGMAGRPLLQDFESNPPSYFVYLDDKHYGYTRIQANSATLTFQYVRNDDLEVHDQVILTNTGMLSLPWKATTLIITTLLFLLVIL